jgi:hypothetical protein
MRSATLEGPQKQHQNIIVALDRVSMRGFAQSIAMSFSPCMLAAGACTASDRRQVTKPAERTKQSATSLGKSLFQRCSILMTSGMAAKQYIGHREGELSSQGITNYGNAHLPPSFNVEELPGEANCFFCGLVSVSRRHLAEVVHVAAPSLRQRLHPRPPHDRYVLAQGQVEPPKCSGVSTLSSEPWVAGLGLSLEAMVWCERRQSRAQQTNNQEPTTRQQYEPASCLCLCPALVEVKLEWAEALKLHRSSFNDNNTNNAT